MITLRETIAKVDCWMNGGLCDTFCDPMEVNSTGLPTQLSGAWSAPSGSGLHLEVQQGPPGQFGYFLIGSGPNFAGSPLGQGRLCLASGPGESIGRYNVAQSALDSLGQFDGLGQFINLSQTSTVGTGFDVPSAIPNQSGTLQSGETWHFQLWHRENGGQSNLSNALSVTF